MNTELILLCLLFPGVLIAGFYAFRYIQAAGTLMKEELFPENPSKTLERRTRAVIDLEIKNYVEAKKFEKIQVEKKLIPLLLLYQGLLTTELCILIRETLIKPRIGKKKPSLERRVKAIQHMMSMMTKAHASVFSRRDPQEDWVQEADDLANHYVSAVIQGTAIQGRARR